MLELYATARFASWFEALSDADAETVATAIEVLQSRADDAKHEHGSTQLLWYRHPAYRLHSGLEKRLQSFLHTADLTRTIVRRMETGGMRARYRELPKPVAQRVDDALAMLRRWAARTRLERGNARVAIHELTAVFGEALLDPAPAPDATALRELQLPAARPRWRIVFGLDREHYADSVRWAVATWASFLAGARDAVSPARLG